MAGASALRTVSGPVVRQDSMTVEITRANLRAYTLVRSFMCEHDLVWFCPFSQALVAGASGHVGCLLQRVRLNSFAFAK
jgi:hypothetical protein